MKSFSLQIIKPKCYFTNYKCEREDLSFEVIKNNLSIVALGGVNEIGKNMYVIQFENDIVVIDCAKFPDESLLGIDLIIPDVTYLQENKEKIRGLVVTHGHEDHIGEYHIFKTTKRTNLCDEVNVRFN